MFFASNGADSVDSVMIAEIETLYRCGIKRLLYDLASGNIRGVVDS
jgi:hypothetical protein